MILLIGTTQKALGQTPDVILHPAEPAPYDGVLISPAHYRAFSIDSLESGQFKANLSNIVVCPNVLPVLPEVSLFSSFGYGFVISIGIVAFIAGAFFEKNH